jgi:hypothetical protein
MMARASNRNSCELEKINERNISARNNRNFYSTRSSFRDCKLSICSISKDKTFLFLHGKRSRNS